MKNEKDNSPLVSIVTIVYNVIEKGRREYVKECIESVRNQTYTNIEHIIIDGASTDGTIEFLKEFSDKGDVVVFSEPDKGIYDAMNKGIDRANGKYINFLNSDDYFCSTDAVFVSVSCLEKDSADYSFADALLFYEDGQTYTWQADISRLPSASHYCHQTMFAKTELLQKNDGFNTSITVSADTDLMIRLYAQKVKYVKIPLVLVAYRVGGFSSLNQKQSQIDHSNAFYKHIGQYCGLDIQDCYFLWNQRLLLDLSFEKQLELVYRLPIEFGQQNLFQEVMRNVSEKVSKNEISQYFLLGFIPFGTKEVVQNKQYFRLFKVIPLLKIVENNNKIKYFLFGFFLVLKVKRNILPI